jgi:hypothetical protein
VKLCVLLSVDAATVLSDSQAAKSEKETPKARHMHFFVEFTKNLHQNIFVNINQNSTKNQYHKFTIFFS